MVVCPAGHFHGFFYIISLGLSVYTGKKAVGLVKYVDLMDLCYSYLHSINQNLELPDPSILDNQNVLLSLLFLQVKSLTSTISLILDLWCGY